MGAERSREHEQRGQPPPLLRLLQRLPELFVAHIFPCVTADELARVPLVQREFGKVCSENDQQLWAPRCEQLWRGKCESAVAPFRDAAPGMAYRARYIESIVDARRSVITEDELCSFEWAFRFKEAVGEDFIHADPYWHNSGYDELGNFHFVPPSNTKCFMRRKFLSDEKLVVNPAPGVDDLEALVAEYWGEDYAITWRFTKSRQGVRGQFVKLNQWPSARPRRNPENWGWIMHNEWVVYAHPAARSHLLSIHEAMEECEE